MGLVDQIKKRPKQILITTGILVSVGVGLGVGYVFSTPAVERSLKDERFYAFTRCRDPNFTKSSTANQWLSPLLEGNHSIVPYYSGFDGEHFVCLGYKNQGMYFQPVAIIYKDRMEEFPATLGELGNLGGKIQDELEKISARF